MANIMVRNSTHKISKGLLDGLNQRYPKLSQYMSENNFIKLLKMIINYHKCFYWLLYKQVINVEPVGAPRTPWKARAALIIINYLMLSPIILRLHACQRIELFQSKNYFGVVFILNIIIVLLLITPHRPSLLKGKKIIDNIGTSKALIYILGLTVFVFIFQILIIKIYYNYDFNLRW